MLALGTPAPDFQLPDVVSGNTISLAALSDKKALLVMFLSPHCPYVRHLQRGISAMAADYSRSSLGIVAISSNDAEKYPDDAPEFLRQMASEQHFEFPFCYDETQETAKAYHAACTPDFFLFDGERRLTYRGQFDDSRRSNMIPVTGKDLRVAIDAVLAGKPVNANQRPSIGCNIKWKPGNEPPFYIPARA